MSEYPYDDEIDLFELLETLWLEKKTIFLSVLIAIGLFGSAYALMSKKMTSDIALDVSSFQDNIAKCYDDFSSVFFNPSVFEQWKQSSQSSLDYDVIAKSHVVDGIVVAKKKKSVSFVKDKKNNTAKIQVVFKDVKDLLAIDGYVDYVNQRVSRAYLTEGRDNLIDIQEQMKATKEVDAQLVQAMLSIKNYVKDLEKSGFIFDKSYPTQPSKKVKPSIFAILSVFVGVLVGCGWVLFRKSWRDYQMRKHLLLSAKTES